MTPITPPVIQQEIEHLAQLRLTRRANSQYLHSVHLAAAVRVVRRQYKLSVSQVCDITLQSEHAWIERERCRNGFALAELSLLAQMVGVPTLELFPDWLLQDVHLHYSTMGGFRACTYFSVSSALALADKEGFTLKELFEAVPEQVFVQEYLDVVVALQNSYQKRAKITPFNLTEVLEQARSHATQRGLRFGSKPLQFA